MYNAIVLRTPVDTGRARGNWNVATGKCDTSVDEEKKSSVPLVDEEQIKTPENGEAIYISNNLPYIRALEYGHSKQSPKGMVGVVVANAENYMKQALAEVNDE